MEIISMKILLIVGLPLNEWLWLVGLSVTFLLSLWVIWKFVEMAWNNFWE